MVDEEDAVGMTLAKVNMGCSVAAVATFAEGSNPDGANALVINGMAFAISDGEAKPKLEAAISSVAVTGVLEELLDFQLWQ